MWEDILQTLTNLLMAPGYGKVLTTKKEKHKKTRLNKSPFFSASQERKEQENQVNMSPFFCVLAWVVQTKPYQVW